MLEKILRILQKSNLFLTGGGGVGKSYIVREVIKYYESQGAVVAKLSSTAVSAVNISGMTLHSFFKLGRSKNLEELKLYDAAHRSNLSFLKMILQGCELIVIDEISMVSGELLELVKHRLKQCESQAKLLFVGDFFQLPPVGKEDAFAFESKAWAEFKPFCVELTQPKRTSEAELFAALNKVRRGEIDDEVARLFESRLNLQPPQDATVLFSRRDSVEKRNALCLGTPQFSSKASIEVKQKNFSQTALEEWVNNLVIPRVFEFKLGAKVIFCANKAGEFYNGEQGVIEQIDKESKALFVRKNNGTSVVVTPTQTQKIEYKLVKKKVTEEVVATFTQFPLCLAYAITIHKSQGMSLPLFVCDLNRIFASGQSYVALSRATSLQGLFLQADVSKYSNFKEFLQRKVRANEKVKEFYAKCKMVDEVSLQRFNEEDLQELLDADSEKSLF